MCSEFFSPAFASSRWMGNNFFTSMLVAYLHDMWVHNRAGPKIQHRNLFFRVAFLFAFQLGASLRAAKGRGACGENLDTQSPSSLSHVNQSPPSSLSLAAPPSPCPPRRLATPTLEKLGRKGARGRCPVPRIGRALLLLLLLLQLLTPSGAYSPILSSKASWSVEAWGSVSSGRSSSCSGSSRSASPMRQRRI